MGKLIFTCGEKRNRLTALDLAQTVNHHKRINVLCDCGTKFTTKLAHFLSGHTTSCGCSRIIHGGNVGGKPSVEYRAWQDAKDRCYNPKNRHFKNYGGRGIEVASEWLDDFEIFVNCVGKRPSSKHSLDRIDNSKGYIPNNVRWATHIEQSQNTRHNVFTYDDACVVLALFRDGWGYAQIAKEFAVNANAVGRICRNERWTNASPAWGI